jgi:hypothetical protein
LWQLKKIREEINLWDKIFQIFLSNSRKPNCQNLSPVLGCVDCVAPLQAALVDAEKGELPVLADLIGENLGFPFQIVWAMKLN